MPSFLPMPDRTPLIVDAYHEVARNELLSQPVFRLLSVQFLFLKRNTANKISDIWVKESGDHRIHNH